MAAERQIHELKDLHEAARVASKDGLCRIRLASGESLVLYAARTPAPGEPVHDVADPGEEQVVLSCLEPGGEVFTGDAARAELLRPMTAAGIKPAGAGTSPATSARSEVSG